MSTNAIDRRTLLRALALLAAGGAGLTAVGATSGCSRRQISVANAPLSMSSLGRAARDEAALPGAVSALTGFSASLFAGLLGAGGTGGAGSTDQVGDTTKGATTRDAAATHTNVVCSPYSIFTALAMARAGAAGATAAAMDTVLGVSDPTTLATQVNALAQTLAQRAGDRSRSDRSTGSITWHEANSLWGSKDMPWQTPFLDTLATYYGTGMRNVDFAGNTEAARTAINEWTSAATQKLIPEILPAGVLDTHTHLVLVNALYLKAPWERTFLKGATKNAPFTRADGTRVQVPMMRSDEAFTLASGEGWAGAHLPYIGRELAMAVVLPDRGSEGAVRAAMTASATASGGSSGLGAILARITAGTASGQVEMPKLKVRTTASLKSVLGALGMGVAFSDDADFSGMTTAVELQIAQVLHEAVVAIDEEGTEAAAATAVIMTESMAPAPPPRKLVLDRPYYLVIHDVATGAPLFLGYIADPNAAAA